MPVLLLFSFMAAASLFNAEASVSQDQKSALLNAYSAWGNPVCLSSWSNTTDPCVNNWASVICDESNTAVTEFAIDLTDCDNGPGSSLLGPMPPSFSSLVNLSSLSFTYSNVDLTSSITYNALTGTLPASWSTMSQLSALSVLNVNLTGQLPSSWSAMSALTNLVLQGGAYVPTTNDKFFKFSRFVFSAVNGTLPAAWGSLTNLRSITIKQHPAITGTLPSQWSNLMAINRINVYVIDSSGNYTGSLSGTLPSAWSVLQSLKSLYVPYNHLTGTLPPQYTAITQNTTAGKPNGLSIYVSGNMLTGTIPNRYQYNGITVYGFPVGQAFPPPPAPPSPPLPPSPSQGHRTSFLALSAILTAAVCCLLLLAA